MTQNKDDLRAAFERSVFSMDEELRGERTYKNDDMEREWRIFQAGHAHAGEWRGIESAPKDGTSVMLYGGDREENDRYDNVPVIGFWDSKDWVYCTDNTESASFEEDDFYPHVFTCSHPTHWMPLPTPPKQGK